MTFVVIGRNEAAHLPGCFAAVRGVDYPAENLEVIYVDTGSADISIEIARAAGAKVIAPGGALTAAQGRNLGWKAARYNIVHFVDGDVFVAPTYLRAAVSHLGVDSVVCVFGRLEERRADDNWASRVLSTDRLAKTPGFADAPGVGGTFLRSVLAEVGGYDGQAIVHEEPDIGQRIRQRGHKILLIESTMGTHDYGVVGLRGLLARSYGLGRHFGTVLLLPGDGDRVVRKPGRKLLIQGGLVLALIFVLAAFGQWVWLALLLPIIYLLLVPYVLFRYWDPVVRRGLGGPAFVYYYLMYATKPLLLAGLLRTLARRGGASLGGAA